MTPSPNPAGERNEEIAEKITAYIWEESEYDVITEKIKEALSLKEVKEVMEDENG